MKLISQNFLIFLIGIFLFSGCEKQEMETTGSESYIESESEFYWEEVEGCVIANENNPVDSAGYIHNVLIGEVETVCSPEDDLDSIYQTCESVYEEHYGNTNFNFSVADQYIEILKENKEEYFLDTLSADEFTKDCFKDLMDIVYKYDLTNFSYIVEEIKSYEETLLNNYDQDEIQEILIGSSIARYSLAYWHDRLCEKGKASQNKEVDWPWKEITVGASDVIGGLSSAAASSLTGPALVGVGIAGGIGTSSAAASVWDVFAGDNDD